MKDKQKASEKFLAYCGKIAAKHAASGKICKRMVKRMAHILLDCDRASGTTANPRNRQLFQRACERLVKLYTTK